jgi:hypothetical protein
MKYFLLLGGFTGFALVWVASWWAGNRPPVALKDAAIGCLVGAILFRVLHAAFLSGLRSHLLERSKLEPVYVSEEEDRSSPMNSRRL